MTFCFLLDSTPVLAISGVSLPINAHLHALARLVTYADHIIEQTHHPGSFGDGSATPASCWGYGQAHHSMLVGFVS